MREIVREYNDLAKAHFGTTMRPDLAGYILTDGSMLNFSFMGKFRDIDHREISDVLDYINTDDLPGAAMIEFMRYGNIRVTSVGFDIITNITDKQKAPLTKLIRKINAAGEKLYVDVTDNDGYTVKTFEYNNEDPSVVFDTIKEHFIKGVKYAEF